MTKLLKKLIAQEPVTDFELEECLEGICESVPSCNDTCPVYEKNEGPVEGPDNETCMCDNDGEAMLSFMRSMIGLVDGLRMEHRSKVLSIAGVDKVVMSGSGGVVHINSAPITTKRLLNIALEGSGYRTISDNGRDRIWIAKEKT